MEGIPGLLKCGIDVPMPSQMEGDSNVKSDVVKSDVRDGKQS